MGIDQQVAALVLMAFVFACFAVRYLSPLGDPEGRARARTIVMDAETAARLHAEVAAADERARAAEDRLALCEERLLLAEHSDTCDILFGNLCDCTGPKRGRRW